MVTCFLTIPDSKAEIRDLGFHLKWNMGFAYDALSYFGADPEERPQLDTFGWKRLAWYLAYAFNERWVLPFSHDNMQPKSLLDQMAPNKRVGVEGQFAQLRLLFLHLGKQAAPFQEHFLDSSPDFADEVLENIRASVKRESETDTEGQGLWEESTNMNHDRRSVHFPLLKVHGGYARAASDVHGLRDWCLGTA